MKTTILLLRHGESLKNTLCAYSTASGKEPLTKYGVYQAECAANYMLEYINRRSFNKVQLFTANDIRSFKTAESISRKLGIEPTTTDNLSAFVGNSSEGKLEIDVFQNHSDFERKVKLYQSGLLSAYEVPWPSGNPRVFERKLSDFFIDRLLIDNCMSIVTTHKSVITCLLIILLKRYKKYPTDYYGYIDIPLGNGVLLEIEDGFLNLNKLDFLASSKQSKTDVVLRDGIIVFPESSCAVCWDNDSLLMVNQTRHNINTWELPGGKIEQSETPINAAIRELKEETGLTALKGELIYSLDLDLSISFHRTYLVSCDFLKDQPINSVTSKWLSVDTIYKMVNDGSITHAPTVVAILNKLKSIGK